MNQKQNYHKTIVLLQQLSETLVEKKEDLRNQHEKLNQQITALSQHTETIKINHDQKSKFDENCASYRTVLENLANQTITLLDGLNTMLNTQTERHVIQEKDMHARQFVKKVVKEVSIGHSRFCFSFEKQKQQLNYMETRVTLHKKQVTK